MAKKKADIFTSKWADNPKDHAQGNWFFPKKKGPKPKKGPKGKPLPDPDAAAVIKAKKVTHPYLAKKELWVAKEALLIGDVSYSPGAVLDQQHVAFLAGNGQLEAVADYKLVNMVAYEDNKEDYLAGWKAEVAVMLKAQALEEAQEAERAALRAHRDAQAAEMKATAPVTKIALSDLL